MNDVTSITVEEAAVFLKVTARSVYSYIAQGKLSYHKRVDLDPRRKYLDAVEVRNYKDVKDKGAITITEFREMQSKVMRLEAHMSMLLRILDTTSLPLEFDKDEIKDLYEAAVESIQGERSTELAEAWLPLLLRVTEKDFFNITLVVNTKQPWMPFKELTEVLIMNVASQKDYKFNTVLQSLHIELNEARKRIRLAAMLFIEEHSYVPQVEKIIRSSPASTVERVKKLLK